MLKSVAGIEIAHVPYKGSAPAMQDVIGGQVDALFDVLPSALPQAQAGKIRIIAIGSGKRVGAFPDVPTTAELGLGEVSMDVWFAAVAPAGSPDAAVRRLSAELGRAIRDPAVNKRFVDVGWNVDPGTPEQLGALMKSEIERWGAVVRRSGAKAD
jgi:tripartite-type tricarboxylate transporter receptor subunit TctC